jgi:hypothetical protein
LGRPIYQMGFSIPKSGQESLVAGLTSGALRSGTEEMQIHLLPPVYT